MTKTKEDEQLERLEHDMRRPVVPRGLELQRDLSVGHLVHPKQHLALGIALPVPESGAERGRLGKAEPGLVGRAAHGLPKNKTYARAALTESLEFQRRKRRFGVADRGGGGRNRHLRRSGYSAPGSAPGREDAV
jgi:hypothetical protein